MIEWNKVIIYSPLIGCHLWNSHLSVETAVRYYACPCFTHKETKFPLRDPKGTRASHWTRQPYLLKMLLVLSLSMLSIKISGIISRLPYYTFYLNLLNFYNLREKQPCSGVCSPALHGLGAVALCGRWVCETWLPQTEMHNSHQISDLA